MWNKKRTVIKFKGESRKNTHKHTYTHAHWRKKNWALHTKMLSHHQFDTDGVAGFCCSSLSFFLFFLKKKSNQSDARDTFWYRLQRCRHQRCCHFFMMVAVVNATLLLLLLKLMVFDAMRRDAMLYTILPSVMREYVEDCCLRSVEFPFGFLLLLSFPFLSFALLQLCPFFWLMELSSHFMCVYVCVRERFFVIQHDNEVIYNFSSVFNQF